MSLEASSSVGWLSITSATSGNGSATINYSVAVNSGQQRSGTIIVGGQNFTVTQTPNQASCSFALNPGSQSFAVGGGNGSFNISTGADCIWDAATTDGWITITGRATGTGNGTVSFTVQPNNSGSRTGSISVRDQVFTITQSGCDFTVSPISISFPWTGGERSITVTASEQVCSWFATTTFGTITSGSSGTGNSTIILKAEANGSQNTLLGTRVSGIWCKRLEFRVHAEY